MRKLYVTTALAGSLLASPVLADPSFMLGVSVNFGGSQSGQVGVTAKVLSDNVRDAFVGVAGVTYFPQSNAWGVDAGVGYNFDNSTVALSYDFLNQGLNLSAGWADLESDALDSQYQE